MRVLGKFDDISLMERTNVRHASESCGSELEVRVGSGFRDVRNESGRSMAIPCIRSMSCLE